MFPYVIPPKVVYLINGHVRIIYLEILFIYLVNSRVHKLILKYFIWK